MVAGKSINVKATAGSNGGFSLSPITEWECFTIANAVAISADGSGSISGNAKVYCNKITLQSRSGNIMSELPQPYPPDFSVNAAIVQFNTAGEVNINNGWPAVLLPSTGNPVQFTGPVSLGEEAGSEGGTE
jgi:hypothetical protein